MQQTCIIRWAMGIGLAMSVTVCWSLSEAGTVRDGRSVIGPARSNTMISSSFTGTQAAVRPMPFAALPMQGGLVLQNIPTVSKPISVGGTTIVPYIGAGFSGGYATEVDRSIHAAPSGSSTPFGSTIGRPKDLLGQNLMPNEVQLGIQFPF